MERTIIHGRKVILNENGWVISDIDDNIPFCELYRKWVNCSGVYDPRYLEQRERLGKVKWFKSRKETLLNLYKDAIKLNLYNPSKEHAEREAFIKNKILEEWVD